MKYFITIVFTLISFTTNIFSQTTPSIQWQKTLGGSGFDAAYSIQQTRDGGYIIAGYTESNDGNVTGNHGGSDYWIVKLDSNENIIWQKTLGGSDDDRAYSIQQTKDGGYVVAGYSSSNDGDVKSENQAYCWIVKLDQNGNIIWQNKIGDLIYGQSIKQTTDGGYIIVGDSPTNDFGIVKLDSNGNVSWQKSFGGKSRGAAYSVQQTTDGGYVVAGYTYSNDISFTNNQGSADYWIVKLDASGNMIWQKTFGGADSEHAYNIQQTADGGYIVAGETWSADGNDFHRIINYWIIKLDINGNIIWQKTLGGSGYDEAYSIKQTRDGGYIIAGYTG